MIPYMYRFVRSLKYYTYINFERAPFSSHYTEIGPRFVYHVTLCFQVL